MIRGLETHQRPALLISECQRGVIEPGLSPFPSLAEQVVQRGIVGKIASLAAAFRTGALPVIHLHVAHSHDYATLPVTSAIFARSKKQGRMKIGSIDVDPVAELAPHPEDFVHSRGFSLVAFHGTDLDQWLRNMSVTTLVLAGVSSNVAISGMALCGSDLGYQVVVPEDCVAGATPESHAFMVTQALPLYATIASGDAVIDALERRSALDRNNT
jgi:nicotinamidase-related amidase